MQSLAHIAHQSIANITKPAAVPAAAAGRAAATVPGGKVEASQQEKLANHVFRYLMARYGSRKFMREFATGRVYTEFDCPPGDARVGQDRGVVAARNLWGQVLSRYSASTIEMALGRLKDAHPEWPPSLNEFEILLDTCVVKAPMRPLTEEERAQLDAQAAAERAKRHALRARQEQLAQLRKRSQRGDMQAARQLMPEHAQPSPMERLHEALAAVLAQQGMDEAKALRMASEKLTPEVIAAWSKGDWRGL